MAYFACYMPALSKDEEDPSRGGFTTREEAWDWVHDNMMCKECTEAWQRIKAGCPKQIEWACGDDVILDDETTYCDAVWLVLSESELETYGWNPLEVMKAKAEDQRINGVTLENSQ